MYEKLYMLSRIYPYLILLIDNFHESIAVTRLKIIALPRDVLVKEKSSQPPRRSPAYFIVLFAKRAYCHGHRADNDDFRLK